MTFRRVSPVLMMAVSAALSGCGQGEDQQSTGENADTLAMDTLTLAVTDTIGVDAGDSNYVFGMIMSAAHGTNGEIAVLDMGKTCLSVYSPSGEFLMNIGSHGPGPGEFQVPTSFAVLSDGRFAVVDAISRIISFFDPQGNYTGQMSDFFPTPPLRIKGGPDGSFVGEAMNMIMTDRMEATLDICRWSDSSKADFVYYSKSLDLNLEGEGQASIQRGPEFSFAVGPDGSVFLAEVSDTLFSLRGFSPAGEEFLTKEEEVDRTPLSQEELDAGALAMSITVSNGEAAADMNRTDDVYPYRNVISSIGVDAQSRIWVEMGNEDFPLFRVYDYQGNLLFYAVTDVPFTPVTRPTFVVDSGGFLACDVDPMDYPKVYVFSLQGES